MSDPLDQLLDQARLRRSLPEPSERRILRERAGLTQSEVAGVLGVNRVAVTRYEAGQRNPRGAQRIRYVELLQRLEADSEC